jgi:hypothetical protein
MIFAQALHNRHPSAPRVRGGQPRILWAVPALRFLQLSRLSCVFTKAQDKVMEVGGGTPPAGIGIGDEALLTGNPLA